MSVGLPGAGEASGQDEPVLVADDLTKRFPGVVALDRVSLTLQPGRVHALVGQNGAGKSTLINILSGMYAPDAGTLRVDGEPVSIPDARRAHDLGIATVYQELSLLLNLTVAQNLALGREPRRGGLFDVRRMREHGATVLGRMGLDIDPEIRVSRLSLAQRQMIEIAKALSTTPKILILDEPTAPLGSKEAEQLFGAIGRLKAQGVAILYVSHRFAEVVALCDTATILRNGKRVMTTELAGWSEADLTDAMIGAQSRRYERQAHATGEAVVSLGGVCHGERVRDVSFDLRRGEVLALTGLLGGGQNEIARMIGGDLAADAGTLRVSGTPRAFASPHEAVAAGICLMTEDRKNEGILPNRSLRENIAIASLWERSRLGGLVRATAERAAAQRAADELGVAGASLETPMRSLSGGNQQKALLARWQLADTDVFVLLEPTRGVDVGARSEIYRRLGELASEGKAVLIVSSDLVEVLTVADRILVVRDGRIAAETRPFETDEERLNLLVQGVGAAA